MALDWGSGATGAIGGAAAGSTFGPVGTAVGGLIGGAAGLFGSKKKKKKKPKLLRTLDDQQEELYGSQMAALRGEGPMAGMYNFDAQGYNNVFDQTIGRPAYRNFQENIIPNITGQFRGNNLMNSSYAGQSLSRAGRDVQENLDAQRSANIFQGQQTANQNKMAAIQNLLGLQTQAYQRPEEGAPSTIDQILNSVATAGGEWLANKVKDFGKTSAPASPTV